MAKDGTRRGGARLGCGRKPKALSEKILEGKDAQVMDIGNVAELKGKKMPPVEEYMRANQKSGMDLCAEKVFTETWQWLSNFGCENLVSVQLIKEYAMDVARWVQCETAISQYGFLAKHPTTGGATQSPYVAMSHEYQKEARQVWFQIFQIVRENSSMDFPSSMPKDNFMESLLSSQGK